MSDIDIDSAIHGTAILLGRSTAEIWALARDHAVTHPVSLAMVAAEAYGAALTDQPLPWDIEIIDGVEYTTSCPRYIQITMQAPGAKSLGEKLAAAAEKIRRMRDGIARPVWPWEKLDQGAIDGEQGA